MSYSLSLSLSVHSCAPIGSSKNCHYGGAIYPMFRFMYSIHCWVLYIQWILATESHSMINFESILLWAFKSEVLVDIRGRCPNYWLYKTYFMNHPYNHPYQQPTSQSHSFRCFKCFHHPISNNKSSFWTPTRPLDHQLSAPWPWGCMPCARYCMRSAISASRRVWKVTSTEKMMSSPLERVSPPAKTWFLPVLPTKVPSFHRQFWPELNMDQKDPESMEKWPSGPQQFSDLSGYIIWGAHRKHRIDFCFGYALYQRLSLSHGDHMWPLCWDDRWGCIVTLRPGRLPEYIWAS